MSNVSMIDGHIDEPKMTDNEIKKAMKCWASVDCSECKLAECNAHKIPKSIIYLINRQKAKIKEFDEKLVVQKGLIDVQKAEIERLQKIELAPKDYSLKRSLEIKDIQAEAIKKFAERLCEGRVSNDPVVIAVKVELKEMKV